MAWRGPRTQASTTARGYGGSHAKARAAAAKRHQPTDPCSRCGHALGPMGPWLHYDHTDSRAGYLGFSHGQHPCPICKTRCNIKAGARKGQRVQAQLLRRTPTYVSRW